MIVIMIMIMIIITDIYIVIIIITIIIVIVIEDACGESPPHHRAQEQNIHRTRMGRRERRPAR